MSEENMSNVEYQATQQQVTMLAGLIVDLPLESFLNRIYHAEAAGPILDPTLWMQAHGKMNDIKRIAEALLEVKKVAAKIRENV
jgi:hypothetical protein